MIVKLVIEGPERYVKRYRMDTSKPGTDISMRATTDEELMAVFERAVGYLFPIPYDARIRIEVLTILQEMERRGLARPTMRLVFGPT